MSERKVLNKYYPPDFDPSKIPRMKCSKNRQFTVRLMAPFNMRCATCGEYIYKGKKFNAKKEDVEGEDYLGIRIFRFYIKCTRCLQEISFKTDPKNTDYEIEAGATRNFMALKLAEEQAEREEEERKEEEASNPMKLLENRTKQSKHELELLESLEELKDLNKRQQNIDYDTLLSQFSTKEAQEKLIKKQEEEDELYIKSVFGKRKMATEETVLHVDTSVKKTKNSVKKLQSSHVSAAEQSGSSKPDNRSSPHVPVLSKLDKDDLMRTIPAPLKVHTSGPSKITIIGGLKRNMNNLVRRKAPEDAAKSSAVMVKEQIESCEKGLGVNVKEMKQNEPIPLEKAKPTALSMLGTYSGSESDSS